MGFFSSRKTDEDFVVHDRDGSKSTTTVVQVIRSRFYGKHKGADTRTETVSGTFISQNSSTASILGHPARSLRKSQSTPLSSFRKASGSSKLKNINTGSSSNLRSPDTETISVRNSIIIEAQGTGAASSSKSSYAAATVSVSASAPATPVAARTTRPDSVTMTLAQRLNELAVANNDGFLTDDEYRILRQNLFERFAGNAAVPTENSIVPASITPLRHQRGNTISEGRASTSSRLSSNFNVDIAPNSSLRTPSLRSPSRVSVRSGISNLLHRATHRGSNRDKADTSSVYSVTSATSTAFQSHRVGSLRRKTSNSSIGTEPSKNGQADALSLSSRTSRRTGLHADRSVSDGYSPVTPKSTTSSLRRLPVPPSSFSPKGILDTHDNPERVLDVFDDSALITSADIKREIAAVEAEERRLMDAFNGLEVTTLAKNTRGHHRHDSRPTTIVEIPPSYSDSTSGASSTPLSPEHKLHLRPHVDLDVLSIRSGMSGHTARSTTRSAHRVDSSRTLPSKLSFGSVSKPGSLHRKSSSSSMGSSVATGKRRLPLTPPVPVPALPSGLSGHSNLGQLGNASHSSLNLTRSTGHLPMSSVPEHEVKLDDYEVYKEIEEFRKRRENVSKRYEERLEYLRAKLKGAQLHEKLMKK